MHEDVTEFGKATTDPLFSAEIPVIVTNRVKKDLMMVFFDKFGYPFREVFLINHPLFPDIKYVFSPRNIVEIIDIFCNFGDDVFDLRFVIFPLFLLLDKIIALYLDDFNFVFPDPFYLFLLILLTLNFLLDHHSLFLFEILCLVNAPSLEGIMLCSAQQSLN